MWRFDATSLLLMMISASKTDALDESEREPQNLPRWLMRSRLTAYQESGRFSRPRLITERSLYCGVKSCQEWSLMKIRKKKARRSRFRERSMAAKKRNEHPPPSTNSSRDHMKPCENIH